MKNEVRFLIVEDDLLIAETITEILLNDGYKDSRTVISVEEAITEIEKDRPTMVLTDIELGREKNGIDLGRILQTKYHLPFIYITSHSSPELLDKVKHTRPNAYIIKPFKNEDLLVAIELAIFNSIPTSGISSTVSEIAVKEGRALIHLNSESISWFENEGNYTTIYLENGKRRVIRISLSELLDQLPLQQFIRIHKSFVVNKKYVSEVRPNSLLLGNKEFPVGRTFQRAVKEFFNL